MPARKARFKIGDLSRLFHIGQDSIRYYEKVGLLHPVRDPSNNYRTYTIDDVRTMNTVRELLDLGFSTDEILAFERDRKLHPGESEPGLQRHCHRTRAPGTAGAHAPRFLHAG